MLGNNFLVRLKVPQFLFWDYTVKTTAPQEQSANLPGHLCGLCQWQSLLCWVSSFAFPEVENHLQGISIQKVSRVEVSFGTASTSLALQPLAFVFIARRRKEAEMLR